MNRFDQRGYLVRLIFGQRPRVFELPGRVDSRVWMIEHGVAVKNQSMTQALKLANRISTREICEETLELHRTAAEPIAVRI